MTPEEITLELLGKSGQNYQTVIRDLMREGLGLPRLEHPRYEVEIPRMEETREIHFEPVYEVETVSLPSCEFHGEYFGQECPDCEEEKERIAFKKEIAEFTAKQKAVGEAILRTMR